MHKKPAFASCLCLMPFTGRWHFVNHRIPAHYRHCFWILERTAIMVWIPYPAMSKATMSSLNTYHWLSHPCFPFSDSTCPLDQSPKSDGNPGVLDQWRHVQSLKCLHLAWYKPSYYLVSSWRGHSYIQTFIGKQIIKTVLRVQLPSKSLSTQLSNEKNPPTFHYTGCLIGILIMAYYNLHITG